MKILNKSYWHGFIFALCLFVFNPQWLLAQTNVSGIITADSVFRISKSPFVVTANLVIDSAYTLTIEPGVVVKFNTGTSVLIRGKLIANGSSVAPITFTANSTSPTSGYWGGIAFSSNAVGATVSGSNDYLSGSIIRNALIEYAGNNLAGVYGAISMTGTGVPFMQRIQIKNCDYPGIYGNSTSTKAVMRKLSVSNCNAGSSVGSYQNNGAGINMRQATSDIYIDSSEFAYNTGAGIGITQSASVVVNVTFCKIHHNNNTVSTNGGGIYAGGNVRLTYNQIFQNTAVRGGGIYQDTVGSAGGKVFSNILYANSGTEGSAYYGTCDSILSNVFAYHTTGSETMKTYRNVYAWNNQFINNSSTYIFRYFGPYTGAVLARNTFSNNSTLSTSSALLRFDGNPLLLSENNLMTNTGFTYTMDMRNNDNTHVVSAQNCFWTTTGTPTTGKINTLIYDVNDNVNQGQINFAPFLLVPRLDCPVSGIISPKKFISGDSLIVYWTPKTGENFNSYRVYYGGSDGVFFSKYISTTDTFCKISALENIDSVGVSAAKTGAVNSPADFISGLQSWYTFAEWDNINNPVISSFTPDTGTTGTIVTITGENFTGATQVTFGGVAASSFVVNSPTSITAVVGRGASGNVKVSTTAGSVTQFGFTYLPVPNILSFSPATGSTGTVVNIRGFNFTGTSSVTLGGTAAASYTLSGDTLIHAVVGSGATGNIIIINPYGSDTLGIFTYCGAYTLTLSDTTQGCGDSVLLTVSAGYKTYLWNNGDTTRQIYAKANGKYYVSVTNNQNCVGSDTTLVILNPIPAPVVSGKDTVCSGSTVAYSTPLNSGRTYFWTVTGGSVSSGQGTNSINVLWGASGTGTVSVSDSIHATGCKGNSLPLAVVINALPTVSISGNDTVCSGNSYSYTATRNAGHYYTWNLAGGTIAPGGQGTDSIYVTWGPASYRSFSVTDSIISTGCKATSALFYVLINASPAVPVISGSNSLCGLSTSTYTVSSLTGHTYTWNVTNGAIVSGQGTSSLTVKWNNGPATGILKVTDSINASGCLNASADFSVNLTLAPDPVITGATSVCANTAASYTTQKNTDYTFTWTITGGTITFGQGTDSIRVSWLAAGTGTLTVKDSSKVNGCKTTTAPFSVTINANPTPTVSGPNVLCAGSSASYKTPRNAEHTYTWFITNGTIISGLGTDSIFVTWSSSATSGLLRVTDSVNVTGCKVTSSSYFVSLQTLPAPVITGSNNVCEGNYVVYTTPVNSGRSYRWTATGGTITSGQGTSTVVVIWGAPGTGTLTVMDSVNTSGCKSTTAPYSVTINAVPTPVISGLINVCENGTYNYSAPSNTGRTYTWTINGGVVTGGLGTSSIFVRWGSAGMGSLILTDSVNGSGCKTTTDPYMVSINATPAPVVSGNSVVCAGTNASYSTTFNSGRTYKWNVSGGTILSGQGSASVTISWGIAGSGSVSVTDSIDGAGCKGTSTPLAINIGDIPNPSITGSNVVCAGGNYIYTTPSNTGRTYLWTISNGTIVSGQGTSNIIVNWGVTGLGRLAVMDSVTGLGCKGTTPDYVVNILPGPNPTISGGTLVCANSSQVYSVPSNTGHTYVWMVTGGVISAGQGTSSIVVDWGGIGTGSIQVMDSVDATNCKGNSPLIPVTISVATNPIISGPNTLCEFANAMYGTANFAGHVYVWDVVNGTILSGQGTASVQIAWGSSGTGTIVLRDSLMGSACSGLSSRNITLNPTPTAYFTPVQSAGNVTFIPTQTDLSYYWLFGDGDSSRSSYPTHTYLSNGNYTVTLHVVSKAGCVNDTSADISVSTVGLSSWLALENGYLAYPNPFNGFATIQVELMKNATVSLDVFDMSGRFIRNLVNETPGVAGKNTFRFEPEEQSSGIYMIRLKVNDEVWYLKLVKTAQ